MRPRCFSAAGTILFALLTLPRALCGATIAYTRAQVFPGGSCLQQTTTTADCSTSTTDPDLHGTAIAHASATLFSLSGYANVYANLPASQQASGLAEFQASFSGLLTITGGTGSAFLRTRVDQTTGNPPMGPPIDFTIVQGAETLNGQVGSGSFDVLSAFIFGVPFPYSAEIRSGTVYGPDLFGVSTGATLDLSFVRVEDSFGAPVAAQFSFADPPPNPIPEAQSTWLVLSGLGVLAARLFSTLRCTSGSRTSSLP